MVDKEETTVRFLFQNINGISFREGLDVMPETATIGALQVHVAALTDTNIHWTQSSRDKVKHQLQSRLGDSRVVCAYNVSTRNEDRYQPGGSMVTIAGHQVGIVVKTGSDPCGRFS